MSQLLGEGGGDGDGVPPVANGGGGDGVQLLGEGGGDGDGVPPVAIVGGGDGVVQVEAGDGVVQEDAWDLGVPDTIKQFFLTDEAEMREVFKNYINLDAPFTKIKVPGDARSYRRRSDRARRSTCALVTWSISLNECGYSLGEGFTAEQFGIDQLGNLRGRMSLVPLLRKTTKERLSKQMKVTAEIIEKDIHLKMQLTPEVYDLLRQLRKDTIVCALVVKHASHDEDEVKTALFMKLYCRLKAMLTSDPQKYANIIGEMSMIPDVGHWRQNAMMNAHLHAFLRRQWGYNPRHTLEKVICSFLTSEVCYRGDLEGLIDFRRNGISHLEADYSVDLIGRVAPALYAASEGFRSYCQDQLDRHRQQHKQKQQDMQSNHHAQLQQLELEQQQERRELEQRQQQEQRGLQQQRQRQQRRQQQALEQRQKLDHHNRLQRQQQDHRRQRQWQQQDHQHEQEWWRQKQQEELRQLQHEYQRLLQRFLHIFELPLPTLRGAWMAKIIADFLTLMGAQLSQPQAMAGACAAAVHIAKAEFCNSVSEGSRAKAVAQQAAQKEAAVPAQSCPPYTMFTAVDISRMNEIVAPNLLVRFQEIMYENNEPFQLGSDRKVPKLD